MKAHWEAISGFDEDKGQSVSHLVGEKEPGKGIARRSPTGVRTVMPELLLQRSLSL